MLFPASHIAATGDAYAAALEALDRSMMTRALRDQIDAIAHRINAAQDKAVYGFETTE